ncbi:hypothetical protein C0J52_24236 [Blattella germanica]|nr:hypothetical protein C0J52_24236 [Blattella germanica]
MVWIFPGEFYFGSSSMKKAGPHFFMDKDVILVYPSYRVGTLGFLSTGDDESPGNYGLKDQVAALHWIKENIQAFGGNCSSITLLGHSSGASSAHLHMMSPLAKGLFHRAISMEGTAINPWARSPNPLRQAQKQGDVFNCPTEPSSSLVACLREVNAVDLVKSIYHLMEWWILPGSGFTPVVENKTNQNPNPYITVEPLELMRNGEIKNVPWLVGGTNAGTAHGDELFYLFKSPAGIPNPASNNDLEVRDLMLSMWTNFAKYGDPTPNNKTENYLINEMKWFPVRHMTADNLHMNYLNIDQVIEVSGLNEYLNVGLGPVKLNMDEDLSEERMAFWDSLPLNENCIINCDKS